MSKPGEKQDSDGHHHTWTLTLAMGAMMSGSGIPNPSQSLSASRPPFSLRARYSSCSVDLSSARSEAPSAPEDRKKAEPFSTHLMPNSRARSCRAGLRDVSTRERT